MAYKKGSKKNYVKKESRAEVDLKSLDNKILDFLESVSDPNFSEELPSTPRWMMNLLLSEKPHFLLENTKDESNDERMFFRAVDGSFKRSINQLLGALYSEDKQSALGQVYLSMSQISTIFGAKDNKEFRASDLGKSFRLDKKPAENAIEDAIYSSGSFIRGGSYETWYTADGKKWRNTSKDSKKYPSKDEIERLGLYKKTIPTMNSYPVWSLEDIYPVLPDNYKLTADKLKDMRSGKGMDLNPDDDFQTIIKVMVDDLIERQGIEVNHGGNRACYYPTLDKIDVPNFSQFTNPLYYAATVVHELAHSTKHLNGRRPLNNASPVAYAIEECVAESTAYILVSQWEETFKENGLMDRDDVQQAFQDFRATARGYVKDYGASADLHKMVTGLRKVHEKERSEGKDKTVVSDLVGHISHAVAAINEGTYTPEMRMEAFAKNYLTKEWQPVLAEANISLSTIFSDPKWDSVLGDLGVNKTEFGRSIKSSVSEPETP